MLVTYQCKVCQVITNSPTTEVFFMLPESIKGGNNTTEIYFNNRISHLEKDCQACKAKNSNHKQTQTMILRPKVLLLALKRFDNFDNKIFTDVEPCKNLQISSEAKYVLKSVIEHHGNTNRSGHITTTLSVGNTWVKCNDTSIIKDCKMPTQGYIFLYELDDVAQNNEQELVLEAPPVKELPKRSTRAKKSSKNDQIPTDPFDLVSYPTLTDPLKVKRSKRAKKSSKTAQIPNDSFEPDLTMTDPIENKPVSDPTLTDPWKVKRSKWSKYQKRNRTDQYELEIPDLPMTYPLKNKPTSDPARRDPVKLKRSKYQKRKTDQIPTDPIDKELPKRAKKSHKTDQIPSDPIDNVLELQDLTVTDQIANEPVSDPFDNVPELLDLTMTDPIANEHLWIL
jgi:hypothetical protein